MKKPDLLLRIVSILCIIHGILKGLIGADVLNNNIEVLTSGMELYEDEAHDVFVSAFYAAAICLGSIIEFGAGLAGVRAKSLKLCRNMSVAWLTYIAIAFVNILVTGAGFPNVIIGSVLSFLYGLGVSRKIEEQGLS